MFRIAVFRSTLRSRGTLENAVYSFNSPALVRSSLFSIMFRNWFYDGVPGALLAENERVGIRSH